MSSLNYLELCRLCLVKDRVHIGIFEGEGEVRQIFLKIAACLPVKVRKDDRLPKQICDDCLQKVELLYQFWNQTANAEKQLLEWLGETVDDKTVETNVKHEHMEQDAGSELANSLSRVEAVLAEAREHESSDNDHFGDDSHKPETDSDDEPLSSLEPTQFINVNLNGSQSTTAQTQEEFLAPSAPSTSKSNVPAAVAQAAGSGYYKSLLKIPQYKTKKRKSRKPVKMKNIVEEEEGEECPEPLDILQTTFEEYEVKPITCPFETCMMLFKTDCELSKHLKVHEGQVKCPICQKEFASKKLYSRHVITHSEDRPHVCMECGKSFKKRNELQSHEKKHSSVDRHLKCEYCDYTTAYKSTLDTHSRRHTQQFPYNCTDCHKGFFVKSWFLEHINFHTGERPFQCDQCEKSFPYTRYLSAHKRHAHPKADTPQLKCQQCNKTFSYRRTYKHHMKSHTGDNFHLCDICGKALSSQEHLKFHRRIHTGEKPNICDICGKGFAKKCNLILHRRVHTGERPYTCDVCEKAFTQRSTLVIHKRYHSGQRPYVCVLCSKGFVCKALLNSHQKTHCLQI